MSSPKYYRGGPSVTPRPVDVRIDKTTGLVRPARDISVSLIPDRMERFGGAYEVVSTPAGVSFRQIGEDTNHYEIVPDVAMPWDEYVDLLSQIVLVPV